MALVTGNLVIKNFGTFELLGRIGLYCCPAKFSILSLYVLSHFDLRGVVLTKGLKFKSFVLDMISSMIQHLDLSTLKTDFFFMSSSMWSKKDFRIERVTSLELSDLYNKLAEGRCLLIDAREDDSGTSIKDAFVCGDFVNAPKQSAERLDALFNAMFRVSSIVVFGKDKEDPRVQAAVAWLQSQTWKRQCNEVFTLNAGAADILAAFSFLSMESRFSPNFSNNREMHEGRLLPHRILDDIFLGKTLLLSYTNYILLTAHILPGDFDCARNTVTNLVWSFNVQNSRLCKNLQSMGITSIVNARFVI